MKTQENKATVDTAKEIKINNIFKAEMNFVLRKKTLHDERRVLLFFVKFLVNNYIAHGKISIK